MLIRILATIILIFSLSFLHAQSFKKWKSPRLNLSYVRYYDENMQIIIQKTSYNDSLVKQRQNIEIGLIVYKFNIPYDLFMADEAIVVFDDDSFLVISEHINIGYYQAGKHQLSIRHKLNDIELSMFKSKKIKNFSIAGFEKNLDKWQKDDCQMAFQKIETEL